MGFVMRDSRRSFFGMTSLNHVADAGSFAWLKPLPFSLFDLFGSGLLALNSLKLACAKEKD